MTDPNAPIRRPLSGAALTAVLLTAAAFLADPALRVSGHEPFTALKPFAQIISVFGKGWVLALLAASVGLYGWVRRIPEARRACVIGWVALACSGILSQGIKHLVGRPRPKFGAEGIVHFGPAWSASLASFPSGHSISAFALAAAWAFMAPRLKLLLFGIASLIGISRIVLGAHYISDVVVGAALGIMVGRWAAGPDRWGSIRKHASAWIAAGLVAGGLFLFFFRLGDVGLFDVDEAVFAEATREMVVSNDYITPMYNGTVRFDKPILFYWLMAGAYHTFGVNELGARAVSAFFGIALVLFIFAAVLRLSTLRWATVSGVLTLTSFEVISLAHAAITDMVLITFITIALLSFFIGYRENHRGWHAGFYIGMALAVLTKGPVGVVLPSGIVFFFLLARGRLISGLKTMWPLRGAALFLAVTTPWYAAVLSKHGMTFIEGFFLKHNIQRFLEPNSGHEGFIGYYLLVILVGFFPWSLFVPRALWETFKQRKAAGENPAWEFNVFLAIWIAVFFIFFSISRTKLPNYVASLFPAMAILTAGFLERRFGQYNALPRIEKFIFVMIGGLLGLFFLAVPAIVPFAGKIGRASDYLPPRLNVGFGPYALAAVFLLAIPIISRVWRWPKIVVSFMAGHVAVLTVIILMTVYPMVDRLVQKPLRDFSRVAGERARDSGGRILVYDLNKPSIVFYARHFTETYRRRNVDEMLAAFNNPEPRVLLLRTAKIPEALKSNPRFHRIGEQGGYTLATNHPPTLVGGLRLESF